jgi:leucyl/phenylalanyl-tRNA--protein transferase
MIDPELLLQGYRLGVFPMAMEDDSIQWFSPDPRAILPLEDFHVPHALRRLVRKKAFETTIDNAFSKVIEECAKREDTWINLEIIESYTRLHELGCAHSVEAWKEGTLAGGLYGVAVGGAFFWRINVPPRHGCIEDRAGGAGRTFARAKIRVA